MTQQQPPADAITAKQIPHNRRLAALPRYFGAHMMAVESMVYQALGEMCSDYHGGFWEYHALSNGGFFMAPTGRTAYSLSCSGNYFDGELSAEATGIVATLAGINRALWAYQTEQLNDRYYELRDFVSYHPERALIMAAID